MAYIILSPDGISIHPTDTYATTDIAKEKFDEWKKRYEKQGYYSSNDGRISLDDLENHCTLVEVEDEETE